MNEITLDKQIESLMGSALAQKQTAQPESTSFGEILKNSIDEVNQLQIQADDAIDGLATGRQNDIHNTMVAMEKADVAFKLIMEIRNKVISAYEEIMRMQV
jgi:flagellar hook-basal body complex protein FliE